MSGNSHICPYCNSSFRTENELRNHKGKNHKNALALKLEAAERKLFVRGFHGIRNPEESLFEHFSQFGSVNSVSLRGQSGPSYILVEFKELEPIERALSAVHNLSGVTLKVRRFQCQLQPWEEKKLAKDQLERSEEEKYLENLNSLQERLLTATSLVDQMSTLADVVQMEQRDLYTRAGICEELRGLLAPYFRNCSVYQFGSSINGFGTRGCDLDIFLDINNGYNNDDDNATPLMKIKHLATFFSSNNNFINVITIPSMRCPLVRFIHRISGIKCDLSLNNRKALHNSHLLRLYGSDPRVRNLVLTVRMWARCQGLTGGVTGGCLFTSYAITMLVMFFLMRRKPRVIPRVCDITNYVKGTWVEIVDGWKCLCLPLNAKLPPSENKQSEVELLKDFFTFFSCEVDWDDDVLVMRDATIMSRKTILDNSAYEGCKIGILTVIDPFVLHHNVVANVNEATKKRFETMLHRAEQITCHWPITAPLEKDLPWGVGDLLAEEVCRPSSSQNGSSLGRSH